MFKINTQFLQNSKMSIKDQYKILNKIGSGLTSTVKRIKERATGKYFAVKIFKKSEMTSYQIYCAMREASILQSNDHINVLQLHNFYMDDNYICLVTDLMQMTLMDYLNDYYDQLSKEGKMDIFTQITQAVDHCHG